jgi:ABC-type bacteriocin/lantibiotic exporter with double-glycine peptidase domain
MRSFDLLHFARWLRRLDLPLRQASTARRAGGLASVGRLVRYFFPYWPYWLLVVLMPPFIFWTTYMGRVTYALRQRIFERVRQMHAVVTATADGAAPGDGQPAPDENFGVLNQELANYGIAVNGLTWLFQAVFNGKAVLVRGMLWWFGGSMVMGSALTLGTLLAIMTYSDRLEGLGQLFNGYVTVKGVQANADRVFALMDDGPPAPPAARATRITEAGT